MQELLDETLWLLLCGRSEKMIIIVPFGFKHLITYESFLLSSGDSMIQSPLCDSLFSVEDKGPILFVMIEEI